MKYIQKVHEKRLKARDKSRKLRAIISKLAMGLSVSLSFAIGFAEKRPSLTIFAFLIGFLLVYVLVEDIGGKR